MLSIKTLLGCIATEAAKMDAEYRLDKRERVWASHRWVGGGDHGGGGLICGDCGVDADDDAAYAPCPNPEGGAP